MSKTSGLAGTQWLTAVQMTNPQPVELVITARLSTAGSIQSRSLTIGQGETVTWDDFLGEVFAFEGNGALFLEAGADDNGLVSPDCRSFAASMRISTGSREDGSFGQGVSSLDPVSGFLGDWVAYFPAVSLWGQPGVNGFRTNVGFWNIGANPAQLRLRILDESGVEVWQQIVTAARHDPFLLALPRTLGLETAALVAEPIGGWLDCAVYISVVDNITGDASFLTSQLIDPDAVAACVGAKGRGQEPQTRRERGNHIHGETNRLRATFLGETQ